MLLRIQADRIGKCLKSSIIFQMYMHVELIEGNAKFHINMNITMMICIDDDCHMSN